MRAASNGRMICIAEDEPEVRSYLETALVCQGYSVEAVQDGEELLAYLAGYPHVSAILLDLIMPRKDGMETLREIRAMHKDLPVVMISGAFAPAPGALPPLLQPATINAPSAAAIAMACTGEPIFVMTFTP